jgi:hypothetical protein
MSLARCTRAALLAVMWLGGWGLIGCDCGREGGDPVQYAGGSTVGNRYESSELYGTWLHYPAGRRYQLIHSLPQPPDEVLIYLGFREHPLQADAGGNISPSAGNAALIEAVEDDFIQIRNDTCSEYYVRVVAVAHPDPSATGGGAGGGGTAGTAGAGGSS